MYIIAYDITKDKNRNKIATILSDYGQRVQYSIFECDISNEQLKHLIRRINKHIDAETDSLYIYFACSACTAKLQIMGKDKRFEYPACFVA